jgi:TP901 family phage tail tape measure protein
MVGTLGTIRGQMVLDVKQALTAYTQARKAHISTVTALHTGAGALTQVGAGMVGIGTAMAAGIGLAIEAAAKFERKLSYFSAVTGATKAEYESVRQKALQLGKDTIFSAGQVADAFVELGKSGITAEQIVGGIGDGVVALAAAADLPLGTAANIMTAAIQTFGLSADHAVDVANKLSGAANASIIDVQDLGVSYKYAGGVAHALGISFDDVTTALGLLGQYGIKGSTAGTTLRQTMVSLTGATTKGKDELEKLGIITKNGANLFFDAAGKAKPLSQIFQILKDHMKNLNSEQQVNAIKTIFQSRAIGTVVALTHEGAAGFARMHAEIGKTTALDVSRKRLNNLSGDVEILRGSLETLAISAGGSVQDFARGFIQGITKVINAFISLPQSTQRTILIVVAVVAALLILVGFFGLLAGAILNFIALGIVLAPVFAAIGAAIGAATTAVVGFTIALLANPITWIVIAIIAVIAALIWFFTQTEIGKTAWANFMKFLSEAWTNIVSVATTVWTALATFFTDLWNTIVAGVQLVWGFIAAYIQLQVNTIVAIFNFFAGIPAFVAGVWNAIIAGIASFIAGVVGFFQDLPMNIGKFFQMLPYLIGFAIGLVFGIIYGTFVRIRFFLFTTVPEIITNVIHFFQQLPDRILEFFRTLSRNVGIFFLNLVLNLLQWSIQAVNGIIGFFVALPGRIVGFFRSLYHGVMGWLHDFSHNALTIIFNIVDGIVGFFRKLPGRVITFVHQMVNNIRTVFNGAIKIAGDIGDKIYRAIRDAINGLPKLVTGIWNNVVQALKDAVTAGFKAAASFGAGIWDGFKKGMGINSPSYIEKALYQMNRVAGEETTHLSRHLTVLQGVGNNISKVGDNMGFSTKNTDASLSALYTQVAAARDLQAEFMAGNGASSTIGISTTQQISSAVSATVKDLQPSENHYDVTVNNPEPEPASDSIPKSIRKVAYMVGS